MLAVLENQPGPARDIVVLNAGAALYVAGVATRCRGHRRAREAIGKRRGAAEARRVRRLHAQHAKA